MSDWEHEKTVCRTSTGIQCSGCEERERKWDKERQNGREKEKRIRADKRQEGRSTGSIKHIREESEASAKH